MKFLAIALTFICANAFAWPSDEVHTRYYCTEGNYFVTGMSPTNSVTVYSNDLVSGVFKGKTFSFSQKGTYNRKTDLITYKDTKSGLKLEVQAFGPYDGGQDSSWGKLSLDAKYTVLSCYQGL